MAVVAFFVTMLRYAELLMPVALWPSAGAKGSPPRGFVARPPSSAKWVLYQNMMRVWALAFVPATLLAGAGSVAVAIALAHPDGRSAWTAVVLAVAVLVGFTVLLWRTAKPNTGVSD